ncbi:MAG: DUF5060 domain-containing protein [Anaerolineales bacterium]
MPKNFRTIHILAACAIGAALLLAACSATATPPATQVPTLAPSPTTAPTAAPSPTPTAVKPLPQITNVDVDLTHVLRYAPIEMKVALQATYTNPYDLREVSLDGVFTGSDGARMVVPGFWDGKDSWKVRFTPSQVGEWNYQLVITDGGGSSAPAQGKFNVAAPDPLASSAQALHGWLQVGKTVNPAYSAHYLAYQDGTPFYGLGYCEALNILTGGFSLERGVPVFNNMKAAGQNFVVWWPLYSNSPVSGSYNQYAAPNMDVIDIVVKDAQKKGVFLVFTIWDHPELRDSTHAWGPGQWPANGFSKLGSIDSFFTSDEAWAWQENLYRYIIARWGYSPAIGMWQTVSEINGTNAYDQTNPWHEKVNAYFIANDPYRHPTTASKSGDVEWPEGHKAMDVPQVHLYDFTNGALKIDDTHAAAVLAHWTQLMWNEAGKPNWVGEFGVPGDQDYPEMFHNSIWAALAAGAAMTPAKWTGGGSWSEMTDAMNADMGRLGKFVADIPLAKLDPSALQVASSDEKVRGWGVAGADGGLFWVQDFSLEGQTIDVIRKDKTVRKGVKLEIQGLAAGTYKVTPYDTWLGKYLTAIQVVCKDGEACQVSLPNFHADMAFKLERKQ